MAEFAIVDEDGVVRYDLDTRQMTEEQQREAEIPPHVSLLEPLSRSELREMYEKLSIKQLEYVIARHNRTNITSAARKVGITDELVYQWKRQGFPIDKALDAIGADGIILAETLLRKSVSEAVAVKIQGLRSKSEKVRQQTASEILDRVGVGAHLHLANRAGVTNLVFVKADEYKAAESQMIPAAAAGSQPPATSSEPRTYERPRPSSIASTTPPDTS